MVERGSAAAAGLPRDVGETQALLGSGAYVADRSLATAVLLTLRLGKPLFLEGEAGVGKTEIAKVLAATLERRLIRLQCYEGLDIASAVYEWNYSRQMIEIRLAEATGTGSREELCEDVFSRRFLIERPLLQALGAHEQGPPVLLRCCSSTNSTVPMSPSRPFCWSCFPISRSRSRRSAGSKPRRPPSSS